MEFNNLKGKVYRLSGRDGNSYTPIIGVRPENLGKDKDSWFTFFSLVHDIYAYQNMTDFSFRRERILADKFSVVGSNIISADSNFFVTKRIWYEELRVNRSDFMNSWLEECRGILNGFGCVRVDDIFRGERTWGCEDEAYRIFGDGSGVMPFCR
jgi:hypothetical protein